MTLIFNSIPDLHKAVAQSHQSLFSRPRPIREKGVACESNTTIGARLDVAASGLWGGRRERTLMDVRVFNPFAPSNRNTTLARPMLQEAREGKDPCIRTKSERSGACYFRPHCDVCDWRPFKTSYKLLQTTGLPASRQNN